MIFFMAMIFSAIFGIGNLIPDLLSSTVISELTLTLIWLELSKRPELTLRGLMPILYYRNLRGFASNYHDLVDSLPNPLRLGILEARFAKPLDPLNLENFSFRIFVANIGIEEITVNECRTLIDDGKPIQKQLFTTTIERFVTLKTQQRHKISLPPLMLSQPGLHKIKFSVYASTTGVGTEIWFHLSKDLSTIRFLRTSPFLRAFGFLVQRKLRV
jgi:hypothetical protein